MACIGVRVIASLAVYRMLYGIHAERFDMVPQFKSVALAWGRKWIFIDFLFPLEIVKLVT